MSFIDELKKYMKEREFLIDMLDYSRMFPIWEIY